MAEHCKLPWALEVEVRLAQSLFCQVLMVLGAVVEGKGEGENRYRCVFAHPQVKGILDAVSSNVFILEME